MESIARISKGRVERIGRVLDIVVGAVCIIVVVVVVGGVNVVVAVEEVHS